MNTNSKEDTETISETMQRTAVNGGQLEYEIRGDGEPVLLIHGSHIAGAFLPLMDQPTLADYRLIRYHRRGFAESTEHDGPFSIKEQAADARALLRHLNVGKVHAVGHSYGGVTALQLALDAPGAVHSLVLLEPALMTVPSGEEFAEEIMAPAIERYGAGTPGKAVDAFMQEVIGPEWRTVVTEAVPGGPKQAVRDAATFFEVEVPALDQWELSGDKAKEISQPVLYVLGSESLPVFEEGRDLVHDWWPQAESHKVQGVNHSLQMKDPGSVAEVIAEFLRRHPI